MPSKKTTKKTSHTKSSKHQPARKPLNLLFLTYVTLIALGIIFIYYCLAFNFVQDDSYITFRYVKNFTEGNGLVFNIGEKVEGYTCFLWVILLSFIKLIGVNFISASQTLGIIFSLLTLFVVYRISHDIFPKQEEPYYNFTFNFIAVLLILSNGAFSYWSVSGMETGLFSFLTTLGIYMYLRENKLHENKLPLSAFVFLLASLTRPEGNLIFAVTVLHKIISTLKSKKNINPETNIPVSSHKLLNRNNILWLMIYIIPGLVFMLWRYSYYGYWLPNTFYAKTGTTLEYFSTGLDYFLEFAKVYGIYGVLIIFTLLNLYSRDYFYEYLYLILLFFIFSIYVILIGGDVLRPGRFFVPLMPVFYILVQEAFHQIFTYFEKQAAIKSFLLIAVIVTLALGYYTYKDQFEQIKRYSELENGLVDKMKISGTWLKNKSNAEGKTLTVAATTIGAVSYYSEADIIDMLGLTDRVIAHNPKPIEEISSKEGIGWKERNYNIDYVLSRKPDYIYFSTGVKPSAYAERGLFTSEEFLKYYYPTYFTIKEYGFTDCIYKRKTDDEVKNTPQYPPNPNYKKTFVNLYNQAMNTSHDKSKYGEAINLYKQALEIAPGNFGAPYEMIGNLFMQTKNNDKAFENYKKAVEIDDFCVMAHYYLSQLYLQKGDTAEAKLNMGKVQKYSPDLLK